MVNLTIDLMIDLMIEAVADGMTDVPGEAGYEEPNTEDGRWN